MQMGFLRKKEILSEMGRLMPKERSRVMR